PIAGVVTERRANTGESTLDNVLFTVADLAVLWADLKIFPNQRSQIAPGDAAVLSADDLSQETILDHVVPSSTGQPFVIARAEVNNSDRRWTPGLLVKGSIRTETVDVPLAIPNRALQATEG